MKTENIDEWEVDLPTLARTIRMLESLPKADIIWIKEWLNNQTLEEYK